MENTTSTWTADDEAMLQEHARYTDGCNHHGYEDEDDRGRPVWVCEGCGLVLRP